MRIFPRETPLVAFALSDPYGLAASIAIAPEFDLFYTQDPRTLSDYALRRHRARSGATRPPIPSSTVPSASAPECDIVYYGKWTAYRDGLVTALAARFSVRVHAYDGESRWSVPVLPPLDTPETLRAGLNRARLALETALLDDAQGRYRGAYRITPRAVLRRLVRRAVAHRVLRRPRRSSSSPASRSRRSRRPKTPSSRPSGSSPTRRPAPPWAAAPASAPCASTPGTAAWRIFSSTCGSGRGARDRGRRASLRGALSDQRLAPGGEGVLSSHTLPSARGANSLPTEGREEVCAAGARAQRRSGVRSSPHPASRTPCAAGADPQRAVATILAGRQGLEPRLTGPEPVVLPLNDLPVARGTRII